MEYPLETRIIQLPLERSSERSSARVQIDLTQEEAVGAD
jgi:hypothetical protein